MLCDVEGLCSLARTGLAKDARDLDRVFDSFTGVAVGPEDALAQIELLEGWVRELAEKIHQGEALSQPRSCSTR